MAFRDDSPKEPIVNAEVEPRRSQRSRISQFFSPDFVAYTFESDVILKHFRRLCHPEAQTWKDAVKSKIESILSNHT